MSAQDPLVCIHHKSREPRKPWRQNLVCTLALHSRLQDKTMTSIDVAHQTPLQHSVSSTLVREGMMEDTDSKEKFKEPAQRHVERCCPHQNPGPSANRPRITVNNQLSPTQTTSLGSRLIPRLEVSHSMWRARQRRFWFLGCNTLILHWIPMALTNPPSD